MIQFLIRHCIRNYEDVQNERVREHYHILGGVLGIFCNIVLFCTKFIVGIFTGSIAVLSDAFNNLTDCASSVITIVSAKMSNRRPDKEHPFGHGRIEYVASLVVSLFFFLVALELLKTAVDKILHPVSIYLSPLLASILIVTIFVKLWMYFLYKKIAKSIGSKTCAATARDSLNDVVATSVTVLSVLISRLLQYPIDGIAGVAVALFIAYGGYSMAKDTIGTLLGKPGDPKTISEITKILMSKPEILGSHDLVIHDYGPGRVMASVHAEVSDQSNIVSVHEIIDELEKKIEAQTGAHIVIHMDPVTVDCEITNALKTYVQDFLTKRDATLSFHDLRITNGKNCINIIFDLVIPCEYSAKERQDTVNALTDALCSIDRRNNVIINVDTAYIS